MATKPDGEGEDVDQEVQLEDAEEEAAEAVKHFDEEVPPQADVGHEVLEEEVDSVGCVEKFPGAAGDGPGEAEEPAKGEAEEDGAGYGEGGERDAGCGFLGLIVGEEDEWWEEEGGVEAEVGGHGEGEDRGEDIARNGLGYGGEDYGVGEDDGGAGEAGCNCEWVEEEEGGGGPWGEGGGRAGGFV